MPFIKYFFVKENDFTKSNECYDVNAVVIAEHISQIMLFEEDDPSLPIKERIKQYQREFSDIIPSNMNDIQLLKFILFGYFSQAIDILQTSFYFNVFPFFSSVVSFLNYNFLLIHISYNNQDDIMKEDLKKSKFIFTIWCEYRKKGLNLSVEAIKSQALLRNFYLKIEDLYRNMDVLGTHENIAKEIADLGFDGFFLDNFDVYYLFPEEKIYQGLESVLQGLQKYKMPIMLNGGDAFVSRVIGENSASLLFQGVNQEDVFTSYHFDTDTSSVQDSETRKYYQDYLEKAKNAGLSVFILEYKADKELSKEVSSYCKEKHFQWYNAPDIFLTEGKA